MHLIKRYMEEALIDVTFSKRKAVKEDVLKKHNVCILSIL